MVATTPGSGFTVQGSGGTSTPTDTIANSILSNLYGLATEPGYSPQTITGGGNQQAPNPGTLKTGLLQINSTGNLNLNIPTNYLYAGISNSSNSPVTIVGSGTSNQSVVSGSNGGLNFNSNGGSGVFAALGGNNVFTDNGGPNTGNWSVNFGAGNDTANISVGNDTISPGGGNNWVYLSNPDPNSKEVVNSSGGNDSIHIDSGLVTVNATGAGTQDFIGVFGGSLTFVGGSGTSATILGMASSGDSISGRNGIFVGGTGGNNTIQATGSHNSTLIGGGNGDILSVSGSGNDSLKAGLGNETLTAAHGSGSYVFYAYDSQDTVTAPAGPSNTTMIGGPNSDTFVSGAGNATITGGGGNDVFSFFNRAAGTTHVTITDFNVGDQLGFIGYGAGYQPQFAAVTGGWAALLPGGSTITLDTTATLAQVMGTVTSA
jgi:Ca2+-binding RTX toxin-like protein